MLVTFHSKDHYPITMTAEPAFELLRLMGLEAKVPGGLFADDVPQALWQLQEGLSEHAEPVAAAALQDKEQEKPVSLNTRAVPLLEMLRRAVKQQHPVHWD